MSDPSPSETLRAAAARIRECSPFVLIAGKRVAVEPLAAILASYIPAAQRVEAEVSLYAVRDAYDAALAFARSILEQP